MIHVGNAPAAAALEAEAARWRNLHLGEQIDADPAGRADLAVEAAGLRLDYSRQRLDAAVFTPLLQLAEQCGLPRAIEGLMGGAELNGSEGRAALHSALRALEPPAAVAHSVLAERRRLRDFVEAVHAGRLGNAQGQAYTEVINIGVGGSDLGPRLLCRALRRTDSPLRAHFLGNLDSAELRRVLAGLDPRRCLVVIASKSFTTAETMHCASEVRAWLQAGGAEVERHCVAVTARPALAAEFGIGGDQVFPMWDWVGGRFSVWSAVGLSVALSLGWPAFAALLEGAAAMDAHFAAAPLAGNLPVIWGLIGIWNRNFLDYPTQVTAAYSDGLRDLPAWLQQLEMESNGKAVDRQGRPLAHPCAPVHWGGVGTHVQHAFFQLLHQGREGHPVDFVLPLAAPGCDPGMQQALLGNALAQSAALSHGRDLSGAGDLSAAERAWRRCPGNRPSSLVWLDALAPAPLGALLAACEHRCFVQGWLWGLNSFDQFGVELGKQLARGIAAGLDGDKAAWPDALLARQARRLL